MRLNTCINVLHFSQHSSFSWPQRLWLLCQPVDNLPLQHKPLPSNGAGDATAHTELHPSSANGDLADLKPAAELNSVL